MPFAPDYFAAEATPLLRLNRRPWKLFYRGLVPKPLRRRIDARASLAQMHRTAALWRPFLAAYFRGNMPRFHIAPKQNALRGEKIIWQYWGQGLEEHRLPEVVRLCFRSVEKHSGSHRIIRLDDATLHEYLDFPDFVAEKRRHPAFKAAFFADLLRLALLDAYGGVWLDASVLLTAPLPESWQQHDCFMFARAPEAENQAFWAAFNPDVFNWSPDHPVQVNNCIIAARAGNELIHTALDVMLNFWRSQNHIPHYFFFQIMFQELLRHHLPDAAFTCADDTLPHHLLAELERPYDAARLAAIAAQSPVHKLDRRLTCRPGSFGGYLKQQYDPRP